MKQIILYAFIFLFCIISAKSLEPIPYTKYAFQTTGEIIVGNIDIRLTLISSKNLNSPLYQQEDLNIATDSYGMFNVNFGSNSSYSNINIDPFQVIKCEIKITGTGDQYRVIGYENLMQYISDMNKSGIGISVESNEMKLNPGTIVYGDAANKGIELPIGTSGSIMASNGNSPVWENTDNFALLNRSNVYNNNNTFGNSSYTNTPITVTNNSNTNPALKVNGFEEVSGVVMSSDLYSGTLTLDPPNKTAAVINGRVAIATNGSLNALEVTGNQTIEGSLSVEDTINASRINLSEQGNFAMLDRSNEIGSALSSYTPLTVTNDGTTPALVVNGNSVVSGTLSVGTFNPATLNVTGDYTTSNGNITTTNGTVSANQIRANDVNIGGHNAIRLIGVGLASGRPSTASDGDIYLDITNHYLWIYGSGNWYSLESLTQE